MAASAAAARGASSKLSSRISAVTGSASSQTATATRATPTPQAWAAAISLS